MSWMQTSLGEVVDLKRGFDLPASERVDGPYSVYSSSGQTGTHTAPAVEGPCVITGRYGTIGNVYFSADACWPLNTSLYSTDFKGNNPRFVYHLLKMVPWREYTTASAVPGINRNHVNLCPVRIPDLETQAAIAFILDSLGSKIAANAKLNGYLAVQCEAIAERATGENTVLESLCDLVTEKADCSEADFDTYVSTESLLPNKMGRQIASSLPQTGKVTVYQAGDILISNIRPYFKKIWYADQAGTCSGDVLVFRAKQPEWAGYLYSCLRNDSFFDFVMKGAKGTKMPRGDKKQMLTYEVSASPNQLVIGFMASALKHISTANKESEHLAALRDALLPKLMSGEVDVSKVNLTQLNSHLPHLGRSRIYRFSVDAESYSPLSKMHN